MAVIEVYFDYASPFAYLASEILPGLAKRLHVEVLWKPIELEALSNYADGPPYSASKRRYVVIDAIRSAEFHALPIAIPKPHPVLSGMALRLAVVAQSDARFSALNRSLFRAAWRDQLDLSDEKVLARCIVEAKGDADLWLREASGSVSSDRLRELTAKAESQGVFGVPSIMLGDELFWGLDSLPMLEWRIKRAPDSR